MSDRQDVEIDDCPQCRGVWLDRGELDKIIERSTAEFASERLAETRGDYRGRGSKHGHGGYGKHGRREPWLHELFD